METERLAQAIKLLRSMQSVIGPSQPDDADEAEAWDEIDKVCAVLASLATAAVEGEPVAWREKDGGEWIYYDGDSEVGEHIAKYQKNRHNVSVFPLYTAAQVAALTAQCEGLRDSLTACAKALKHAYDTNEFADDVQAILLNATIAAGNGEGV